MTAVQVNDFLDDCKPKPISGSSMGQIALIELIKDMILRFGRYFFPLVRNPNRQLAICLFRRNRDLSANR